MSSLFKILNLKIINTYIITAIKIAIISATFPLTNLPTYLYMLIENIIIVKVAIIGFKT